MKCSELLIGSDSERRRSNIKIKSDLESDRDEIKEKCENIFRRFRERCMACCKADITHEDAPLCHVKSDMTSIPDMIETHSLAS